MQQAMERAQPQRFFSFEDLQRLQADDPELLLPKSVQQTQQWAKQRADMIPYIEGPHEMLPARFGGEGHNPERQARLRKAERVLSWPPPQHLKTGIPPISTTPVSTTSAPTAFTQGADVTRSLKKPPIATAPTVAASTASISQQIAKEPSRIRNLLKTFIGRVPK
jgi:hypothetical protein